MTAKRREQCRAAQQRYARSVKGKATLRRYRRTPKGRACVERISVKRIFVGARNMGYVATAEQAQAINAHIRRRIRCFHETRAQNAS